MKTILLNVKGGVCVRGEQQPQQMKVDLSGITIIMDNNIFYCVLKPTKQELGGLQKRGGGLALNYLNKRRLFLQRIKTEFAFL